MAKPLPLYQSPSVQMPSINGCETARDLSCASVPPPVIPAPAETIRLVGTKPVVANVIASFVASDVIVIPEPSVNVSVSAELSATSVVWPLEKAIFVNDVPADPPQIGRASCRERVL